VRDVWRLLGRQRLYLGVFDQFYFFISGDIWLRNPSIGTVSDQYMQCRIQHAIEIPPMLVKGVRDSAFFSYPPHAIEIR
jgi:hypothetical protein